MSNLHSERRSNLKQRPEVDVARRSPVVPVHAPAEAAAAAAATSHGAAADPSSSPRHASSRPPDHLRDSSTS